MERDRRSVEPPCVATGTRHLCSAYKVDLKTISPCEPAPPDAFWSFSPIGGGQARSGLRDAHTSDRLSPIPYAENGLAAGVHLAGHMSHGMPLREHFEALGHLCLVQGCWAP